MLMDIDSKIIKGKEKQIQIENIIFHGECESLLNPKIKKSNNKDYNDAIDKMQFNLIKSILTRQIYIKEFKSNNFYKAMNTISNSFDDKYKRKFLFTFSYYYYNTSNLPYNTYQSNELFDTAELQVDSTLRKINDNILQKKLGSKLK